MLGLLFQVIASLRLARKFPRSWRLWVILFSLTFFAMRALTRKQEKLRIN